jgi:hypothetical protein
MDNIHKKEFIQMKKERREKNALQNAILTVKKLFLSLKKY